MSRTDSWIRHGLMTPDGLDLAPAGERCAEYETEARAGYWDPPAQFDDPGPGGHGWAPDPFPGGGLI